MHKTIFIFGDSMVWGVHDPKSGGWAQHLKSYFEQREYEDEFFVLGIPGDTTESLRKRFVQEVEPRKPHSNRPVVMVFAIGINDSQYYKQHDKSCISLVQFKENISLLIKEAEIFTQEIIFIGLTRVYEADTQPTSWGVWYSNERIALYDELLRGICFEKHLAYIPLSTVLGNEDILEEDGLHPNTKGHKKIFITVKGYFLDNNIISHE